MGNSLIEGPRDSIPRSSPAEGKGRDSIKLVSCIIRPERLEAVKEALNSLHAVGGMTVADVRGFGRQKGQVEHYRGGEYTIRFVPKVRLDIAVQADHVDRVMAAVGQAARKATASKPGQAQGLRGTLLEQLRTPASLRNAILLREILGSPKGLQSTQSPSIFSPL